MIVPSSSLTCSAPLKLVWNPKLILDIQLCFHALLVPKLGYEMWLWTVAKLGSRQGAQTKSLFFISALHPLLPPIKPINSPVCSYTSLYYLQTLCTYRHSISYRVRRQSCSTVVYDYIGLGRESGRSRKINRFLFLQIIIHVFNGNSITAYKKN